MKRMTLWILIIIVMMLTACSSEPTGKSDAIVETEEAIHDKNTAAISNYEEDESMSEYDFSVFDNVEITGIELETLSDLEQSVLYRQAKYCQAMTEADMDTMAELVAEDVTFTHMSGLQQTREEYFADVESGRLRYFSIGIENPVIEIDGDFASVHYTSVLNANAYGARGVYRMEGTHKFENVNGEWIATKAAQER